MNKIKFILILLITFLPLFAFAAPPDSVGPVKPVEVLNTPTVIIESIPNITIQNDAQAPVPVNIVEGGGNGQQTRLVGFVNSLFEGTISHPNGFTGYYAMHQYCKDTFVNIDTRACYASEVSVLPLSTDPAPSFNWVIRSRDVGFYLDNIESINVYDAGSGISEQGISNFLAVESANNLDCNQHLSNSANVRGQVVSRTSGAIQTFTCNQTAGIACCSIEAVPAAPPPEPDPVSAP